MTSTDGIRRFRATGRVQGVGYRDWVVRQGKALGLDGWVRNRADGSVEVLARGAAATLDHFADLLRQGPPHARVDGVAASPDGESPRPGFHRAATL